MELDDKKQQFQSKWLKPTTAFQFSPSVLHFSTFTKRPPSVSLQTGTVTTLQSLDLIELNYFKLSKASSAFVFFQRNPPKRERKKPFFLTQYFSLFLTLALPIVQRYHFFLHLKFIVRWGFVFLEIYVKCSSGFVLSLESV